MRAHDWQAHLRVGDCKKSLEAVGLDTGQKRAIAMSLVEDYAIASTCGVLALPRSSYYYQASQQVEPQDELQAALLRLAAQWPTYGYRRLTAHLHREGCLVNSKSVRQLMAQLGLTKHAKPRKVRTTNSQHSFWRYPNLVQGLSAERPEQIWVADITYIRLQQEFVYLAVLMDVFTRGIRGWHLGRSLDQELTLTALGRALAHARPEIHHSDQGVQYAATAYVSMLQEAGAAISMAQVGEPTQNGYAERLMRTIKEEQVDLSEYLDYHDAYQQLGRFLDEVYTHKRIHSALGYLTPAEFESQWWTQQRAVELTHFQQSVWCTEFWAQYTSSTSFIPALVTHFILFDVSVHVFDRSSYSHLNHEI